MVLLVLEVETQIMVSRKDTKLTLIKSIDGTMKAAGLAQDGKINDADESIAFKYTGKAGEVSIELSDNVLSVTCKKDDGDFCTVSQILFECDDESFDIKDIKSSANEISESVSSFFGTECVYDTQENKNSAAKSGKGTKNDAAITPEIEEFLAKGKKKKEKESTVTYEPENLANRMENIFPVLKGELDKNIEKYGTFLSEEYFETLVTPKIVDAIKLEDKPVLKKIFNAFNIFFDEGDNDMQSLIVVSILGVSFANDDTLLPKCEKYMSELLYEGITPVVHYLKTSTGKKKIKDLENPKPYKPKKFGKNK